MLCQLGRGPCEVTVVTASHQHLLEMLLFTLLLNPRFCGTDPQSLETERDQQAADYILLPTDSSRQAATSSFPCPGCSCAQPTQVNPHSPGAAAGDSAHCSGCATPVHLLRWPREASLLPREDTRVKARWLPATCSTKKALCLIK